MLVFTNGFWHGFNNCTDGVNFSFFKYILEKIFNQEITLAKSPFNADILLESYFSPSILSVKQWKYSIFFSGEALYHLPSNIKNYTLVLGCQNTGDNFVSCPLFIIYEFCKPYNYQTTITSLPSKNIGGVISNSYPNSFRNRFIQLLEENNIQIDMGGRYNNNITPVPGKFYEQPIINFYSDYKIVLALENSLDNDYITEKIINPLRAHTIPLYYGSELVTNYINPKRIIQIDPNNIDAIIDEINKICSDNNYWLSIVNQPIFIKPVECFIKDIIDQCKIII